jgi:hypothetical protein
MPRLRQISLNGNAGAFVNILATIPTRSIELMEDEATAPQGLQVQGPLDGFATTNVFSFGSEPIQIPNMLRYPSAGPSLGFPVQGVSGAWNFRAADKLVSARSNGAAATTLRFIENE